MSADASRVEVGFIGQQVITLKLEPKELDKLRKGLSGGGWMTLATDDGEVDIDLAKVAFVRVASSAQNVGFGQIP